MSPKSSRRWHGGACIDYLDKLGTGFAEMTPATALIWEDRTPAREFLKRCATIDPYTLL
jgi:hypothetical protein